MKLLKIMFLLIFSLIFNLIISGESCFVVASDSEVSVSYPVGLDATVIEKAVSGISEEKILQIMEKLCGKEFLGREYGTETGRKSAEYLASELQSYGYTPTINEDGFFQNIPEGTYRTCPEAGQNVMAILPGSDPQLAKKYIVLCAHYDHLGFRDVPIKTKRESIFHFLPETVSDEKDGGASEDVESKKSRRIIYPGADDNASSVTVLLSVAKALKELPVTPKYSILFLFFDGEEKGLLGSRFWITHPTIPLEDVILAINLDMTGRLDKQSRLYIFSTRTGTKLKDWYQESNDSSEPLQLIFPWSNLLRSDHAVFVGKGIPASMMATGLSPAYHTPEDTVDKINIPGMKRITIFLCRTVLQMACAESEISEYRKEWYREKCPVEDEMSGFFDKK
ncbi:MAG: M28 family peptidase [Planctomycetia bacterium]|nr:M28 family peptidase [Planctomycetia bacterium]